MYPLYNPAPLNPTKQQQSRLFRSPPATNYYARGWWYFFGCGLAGTDRTDRLDMVLKVGGLGAKLLGKLGWEEGEGLGAKKDGVTEPVKPRRHRNRKMEGIGQKKGVEDNWWEKLMKDAYGGDNKPIDLFNACEGRRCRPHGTAKLARLDAHERQTTDTTPFVDAHDTDSSEEEENMELQQETQIVQSHHVHVDDVNDEDMKIIRKKQLIDLKAAKRISKKETAKKNKNKKKDKKKSMHKST